MTNLIPCSPFTKNTPFDTKAAYWWGRLWETALTFLKWKNLPDVDELYLNATLLSKGYIIGCKRRGKLWMLDGAYYDIDPYYEPTRGTIANPILGTFKGVFGKDMVLGFANVMHISIIPLITEFSKQLAAIDTDIQVELDNAKATKIFRVNGSEETAKVKRFLDDIHVGKPAILDNSEVSLFDDIDKKIFTSPSEYNVTQMLKDRRTIINDFLTKLGINNTAVEKDERVNLIEATMNDQEILINREFWLKSLRKFCTAFNAMFGTSVSVSIIGDDSGVGVEGNESGVDSDGV